MASLFKIGAVPRDAAADGVADAFDGGTPPARIEHRTGAQPTNVADASSGTLLGTNIMSNPAFGAASAGVVTASAITDDSSADASGTAGYFRCYTGAGGDTAALAQGNSGTSDADAIWDNNVIVAGGEIAISSFTITMPIS
jgi:hypothetical protein